jgi:osmoprotectant transport system permease protein
MKNRLSSKNWLILLFIIVLFAALLSSVRFWEIFLHFLFPSQTQVLYPNASLLSMVGQHLILVGISSVITILMGIPLGVWVTRPSGRDFLPLVTTITSFGQTFPPVAVLALAVPALGFGLLPTIVALFLYGLLPVVRNTVAGLNAVSQNLLDAALGMGMNRSRMLLQVELPLSAGVILSGIRISVIINIGTAMIGATIGAGGLGVPVIAGLVQGNIAYVIEGAVPAAILAVLINQVFSNIEKNFIYRTETA